MDLNLASSVVLQAETSIMQAISAAQKNTFFITTFSFVFDIELGNSTDF